MAPSPTVHTSRPVSNSFCSYSLRAAQLCVNGMKAALNCVEAVPSLRQMLEPLEEQGWAA
ncbi:hypothetical protein E2C01_032350 [Portunus trituberculatus]|uniref:Uncharacterized protein n=1 Tax=Portunus trituberculatus TaxID=210409 RepID=A0A5B7F2J7_PORTR|nr:hypothetical protein [Portunus trituberculatus]